MEIKEVLTDIRSNNKHNGKITWKLAVAKQHK